MTEPGAPESLPPLSVPSDSPDNPHTQDSASGEAVHQPGTGLLLPPFPAFSPALGGTPTPEPSPADSGLSVGAGGVAPSWSLHLQPYPLWGQNVDWTWQGGPDVNHTDNCLPESVAMALMYLREVELPAAFVKDVEYGQDYTGYTDLMHAADFLLRVGHMGSKQHYAATAKEWQYLMWRALDKGHPFLGVYAFSKPGANDGHCRGTVYMDASTIRTADPWTAMLRVESYADNWAWSQGWALEVEAVRWHK